MERHSSRTIDEMRKVALPQLLRQKLDLENGSKFWLLPVDTIAILLKAQDKPGSDYIVCEVDELGRMELSHELMQKIGWEIEDKLTFYNIDNLIIIQLDEKADKA